MATFSQRYGFKPVRSALQVDDMDQDLRVGLWNALEVVYWNSVERSPVPFSTAYNLSEPVNRQMGRLCRVIWAQHLKQPLDTLSNDWQVVHAAMRKHFFACTFNEVYDFLEFAASEHQEEERNGVFIELCNSTLKREASGYRFVGGQITRIIDPQEIAAIEAALQVKADHVRVHLDSALDKLSDRKNPDYRNSVKESISAVEASARGVSGKPKANLDDALRVLEKQGKLHPALNKAFLRLFDYTSDAGGIRHALTEDSREVSFDEAKFMLVACSAFVSYALASPPKTE